MCTVAVLLGREAGCVGRPRQGEFLAWGGLAPPVTSRGRGAALSRPPQGCGKTRAASHRRSPPLRGGGTLSSGACAVACLTLPCLSHSTVHQVSRCLRMCTSVLAEGVSIMSQPTSWTGWNTWWAFADARIRRTWWMSSAVSPGLGASCGGRWRGAVLAEAEGGRCSIHGRDQDVFCQFSGHEMVFPFQVSGDGGFRL